MKKCLVIYFVLLVLAGFTALANAEPDDGPRFGPEFTYADTDKTRLDPLLAHIRANISTHETDGERFLVSGLYYISPRGWTFTIGTDQGVVEITMSPMTVAEYARDKVEIQNMLFDMPARFNLVPATFLGGGHINVDLGYFTRKQPLLLRNFLVDWLNHSELSMGIFGYDTNNALPYALSYEFREQLQAVFADFDSGKFGPIDEPSAVTVMAFVQALRKMEAKQEPFMSYWDLKGMGATRTTKQAEISFADAGVNIPGRFEIRPVRPQTGMEDWLNQITLIRDRIRYLEKTFIAPIPYIPFYVHPLDRGFADLKLTPPLPAKVAFRQFYRYLVETGHNWKDHRDYLWPQWRTLRIYPQGKTELEIFEDSPWFKCREFLSAKRSAS